MPGPQNKNYDNQNILKLDIDNMFEVFIRPIDDTRSHFNALQPDAEQFSTPEYQESRCSAYYRMIGFPVVEKENSFYSPGYDPNINLSKEQSDKNNQILKRISSNRTLADQFEFRESIPIVYGKIFSDATTEAQAIALGSIFIREFDKQLGDTDPLVDDKAKLQVINERLFEVATYYDNISEFSLQSKHQLKPFVVDPRIDATVRPNRNRICAPFLFDKTQTQISQTSNGKDDLKRPFIEKVIAIRFNNANKTSSSDFVNSIIDDIKSSIKTNSQENFDITNNAFKNLNNSEIKIFDEYYKLMRAIINKLYFSINRIQKIRQKINFKYIPDQKNGPEAGSKGSEFLPVSAADGNNNKIELDIVQNLQAKYLDEIDFSAGIVSNTENNQDSSFVFSGVDDIIGIANKKVEKSYNDVISKLESIRNQAGNEIIENIKVIEIIMGEFSGLGLIDIVAIQSALFTMKPNSLLGLIDKNAFDRISFQKDINLNGAAPNDVISSLKEFEKQLKLIYSLIQKYFNAIQTGDVFKA